MIKNQWSNIGWKIEKDKKLKETKILKLVTTKARKEPNGNKNYHYIKL